MPALLRRSAPLLTVGLALSIVTVACGGSGKAAPAAVAAADVSTTTTTPGAAYTACLRQHGVDLPDRPPRTDGQGTPGSGPPGSGPPASRTPGSRPAGTRPSTTLPPGVDAAALQAARQACQSLLPTDRPNGPGTQNPAFQAYASCLKDHGVAVADGGGFGGVNRDDPTFKAADAVCAPLRPTQGTQP